MIKRIFIYLQSVFYVFAGINHFRNPQIYSGLIPPYLSWHSGINTVSGLVEIIFGLGMFLPITRKWAAYGIILMLITFIPSHIYFIQIGSCIIDGLCVPQWVGWIRLLIIHPLLIMWAWYCRK